MRSYVALLSFVLLSACSFTDTILHRSFLPLSHHHLPQARREVVQVPRPSHWSDSQELGVNAEVPDEPLCQTGVYDSAPSGMENISICFRAPVGTYTLTLWSRDTLGRSSLAEETVHVENYYLPTQVHLLIFADRAIGAVSITRTQINCTQGRCLTHTISLDTSVEVVTSTSVLNFTRPIYGEPFCLMSQR